ncbi:uncharacterized protein LOC132270017 [Cornus florida]|uniref:uncharacterized protein LOC132270017 n=1 Tax=Cornus florida TaxID=4283 RepID=UPI002897BCF6|nr:uncharacterized protein LOC132270017 [Cornus florida]
MRISVPAVHRREAAPKAKEVVEETKTKSEDDLEEDEVAYLAKRFRKFRFGRKTLISDCDAAPEEDKFEETKEEKVLFMEILEAPQTLVQVKEDNGTEIKEIRQECERLIVTAQFDGGNVIFRDNQRAKIIRIGTASKSKELPEIQEVQLVEGLKHNLLSVSQLCDSGKEVCFNKERCNVIDLESK